ncbi:hypothetical protein SAMN05661080_03612 [Modestobacter sp. DSM 44400]|uniref:hypothetical protein n=1 Tax=Modestobacter sp. DSM 44400 TaxID=1550230 RepID=UPI00089C0041|nr:hypothetical protein [Modestobacter sp. DSM 44400]SDY48144.1 hypothetical protein SAMN05661080_03612 [Modestobacter sp. DSM 44400]
MTTSALEPYRTVGRDDPFWILQYDKKGASRSPETLERVRDALRSGEFTDVVVFSHGWNNDWETATERYDHFVDGVVGQFPDEPRRRALLVGIFWPSALLVLPGEREPDFASDIGEPTGAPVDPDAAALDDVAAELTPADAARVRELAAQPRLDPGGTAELAELLAPLYRSAGPELGESVVAPDGPTLAASWQSAPPPVDSPVPALDGPDDPDDDDFGAVIPGPHDGPRAAGFGDLIDPRSAVRGASVWLMKDRAGRVGTAAVGPLVRHALAESQARVHLMGHSFGAKVVLSAVAAQPVARPVHSMLLLQPAVNHLCFAEAGNGEPAGGYRVVLDRVEKGIFSTYSAHDKPLTQFFHWALRRDGDLREPLPAPWPDPPSVYAALGGYGPHGAEASTQWHALQPQGGAYQLDPERKLVALDGTRGIAGHSAISVPATWWAFRQLVWS